MSRLFTPSKGVNLLATELLRKPSKKEMLLGQATASPRGGGALLNTSTLPLLIREVLRQPAPQHPSPSSRAVSGAVDPAASFVALPQNRWQFALGVVSSSAIRRAGVRLDPDLWGTIEGAAPNDEARAKCAAALKQIYRPSSSTSSTSSQK